MVNKMLLSYLVEALIEVIGSEKAKVMIDSILDKIEAKVEASPTKLDDIIILPLIKKFIREPFGIKDND